MRPPRTDRIFPLKYLTHYAGSEILDTAFWLPPAENRVCRIWLLAPESSPTIGIDDISLSAQDISPGTNRWIDYGTSELPANFTQLRVLGMPPDERDKSYLLISAHLDFSPTGCTIEEAERKLWGLARCDAGSTTISPSKIQVGSPSDFVVRYTAGPKGLPRGGEVLFTIPKAFATPQTKSSDKPGFTYIKNNGLNITIVDISVSAESHEKIDIICRIENGLAPGESFELHYNTNRTYIFPCRLHKTDRRYWYIKMAPLAASVALSEAHPFVSIEEENGHTVEFHTGPVERLHLFLPGRRYVSEELYLRGTFTDYYRNTPPRGPIMPDIELLLVKENEEITLGSPADHFKTPHRFEIPLPPLERGIYRAIARKTATTEIISSSNPLEVIDENEETDRIYWGEIHGHTEMSDGLGDFNELYRHARYEGCLDFAGATDHACYFSDNQWLTMQDITNSWNKPDEFVSLIGYEWAGKQVHRNIYTLRDRLKLFRGMYPPTSNINVVWDHFHGDEEIVGGPHAPMAHGLIWEFHDPSVERFIEIYSMWGASDFRDSPLVPEWVKSNSRNMTVNEVLKTGAKLGFTGGGDCHEGHVGFSSEDPEGQGTTSHTFADLLLYRCGMTASVMPHLDRRSLIRALRDRKTYATTGARVLLDFSAAGFPMGAEGKVSSVECVSTVHGVENISEIRIIKDGEIAFSEEYDALDIEIRWLDPDTPAKKHYYYLQVIQSDGQMAWSSPVWISPPSPGNSEGPQA